MSHASTQHIGSLKAIELSAFNTSLSELTQALVAGDGAAIEKRQTDARHTVLRLAAALYADAVISAARLRRRS
jgi:hypothetical protein